ncbi:MAG: NADH-quinone oxidoreductase subunit J [Candidatus Electrothrix aestuarii]|uniref:NADH-quinone oxidoreductase subunit J n=1 Tax=Candidatus Electrothrix aestuarii TaxID=3062594 RepID=A0AAU8LSY8_9BACT|nr:NADH-quinone oxidoreductase subunit J [Candidatus Electrothrix aestuarii]
MTDILFYTMAALLVMLSFFAVSLPNLLHSATALIGSFIITAVLYIMLQIEILALAQIMLYIGGIVVFMLLIILLTTGLGGVDDKLGKITIGKWISKGAITALLFTGLLYFFTENSSRLLDTGASKTASVTIDQIGVRLLSLENGFIVPFEVVSLLLLAALVGAVVIARKDTEKKEDLS